MIKPLMALAIVAWTVSAQAGPPQKLIDQYAGMCVKSVKFPAPIGESDLKDNPKLQAYCTCFGEQFAESAMRALQNPPQGTMASHAAQAEKDELVMRNVCRQKFGLPLRKPS